MEWLEELIDELAEGNVSDFLAAQPVKLSQRLSRVSWGHEKGANPTAFNPHKSWGGGDMLEPMEGGDDDEEETRESRDTDASDVEAEWSAEAAGSAADSAAAADSTAALAPPPPGAEHDIVVKGGDDR